MDRRMVKRDDIYIVPTRGLVVVDRQLEKLGDAVKKLNIMVIKTGNTSDASLKQTILPGRIFITCRPHKFEQGACCYEYGIVDITAIASAKSPALAKRISDEIARRKLWNRQYGWILSLKRRVPGIFKELIG